jgi:hypothetical protein
MSQEAGPDYGTTTGSGRYGIARRGARREPDDTYSAWRIRAAHAPRLHLSGCHEAPPSHAAACAVRMDTA